MSFLLPKLTSKKEIDEVIRNVAEKVLVLRFGKDDDSVCLQLDEIVSINVAKIRLSHCEVKTFTRFTTVVFEQ